MWMEEDDMRCSGINEESCACYGYNVFLLEATLFIFADETKVSSNALVDSVSESCLTC